MWIVQLSHDNGGYLTAVIGLFPVLGAPKTEEKRFVLISARALPLDLGHSRPREPFLDEARQVETGPGVRIDTKKIQLVARATLEQLVGEGMLDEDEAFRMAEQILYGNVKRLYPFA